MKKTSAATPATQAVKMPFLPLTFGIYGLWVERFKYFMILGSLFALVLSVIYIGGGLGVLCGNTVYQEKYFCTRDFSVFLIVRILVFFIFCMFMRGWYQVAAENNLRSWRFYFIPQKADFKIFGLWLLYLAALLVACGSAYLLYVRIPNPNWRIELLYFAVVSLGFFVPLLALRFFSYFAFAAAGIPLPAVLSVWQKTKGNGFALLSSAIILLFIGLFISMSLLRGFMLTEDAGRFYVILGCEYLSHLLSLFIAACFMNYCLLQKKFLYERNENGKSGN